MCSFRGKITKIEPAIMLISGETKVIFTGKPPKNPTKPQLRMGESIDWDDNGLICKLVRVDNPPPSHREWVSYFHEAKREAIQKLLAKDVVYHSPDGYTFVGIDEVFDQLERLMHR